MRKSLKIKKVKKMIMKRFKLEIELVPATAWFSSLYRLMPPDRWTALKREVYAKEGHKCYICGTSEGPFELHEFWEYDDERHVQKLIEVHHLCRLCHKIKHIGFWCYTEEGRIKLEKEGLTREDLIRHFCQVNNCSYDDFLKHEEEAFDIWERRSKHEWRQDFGEYNKYIKIK